MSQPSGSFLQSWEWGMWQEKLGRIVSRFAVLDGADWIMAAQFIKVQLSRNKYYLYAPYGPVGNGKLSAASADGQITNFKFFTAQIQQKYPDAVFIRIEPQNSIDGLSAIAIKTVNIQPGITIVADVRQNDETLLQAMHSKTRYNIRVAQKHGVEVQGELMVTPGHGLYVQEAVDLILQTQRRQNYRGHDEKYYKSFLDFFAVHNHAGDLRVHIYQAIYRRQLLVTGIMVDFGQTRMYLYGGSSEQDRNVMAPYLLHWQAMRDAREAGLSFYDFGGSEVSTGGERGFTRFKRGFGGKVIEYAGAYDIVESPAWYRIYSGLRWLNRKFS